jgi:hypothetical protein
MYELVWPMILFSPPLKTTLAHRAYAQVDLGWQCCNDNVNHVDKCYPPYRLCKTYLRTQPTNAEYILLLPPAFEMCTEAMHVFFLILTPQ